MRSVLGSLEANAMAVSTEATSSGEEAREIMEAVKSLSTQLSQSKPLYLQGAVKEYMTDKRGKRKRNSSVDQGLQNSPNRSSNTLKNSSFDINWDLFKSWPQGVHEEERAMIDYFRRLKMTHIEQETKNLFLHSINDGTQTVFTAAKVQQLEMEVQDFKSILKERKRMSTSIRNQIESLADELKEFEMLQMKLQKAEEISSSIKEMELELERLKASRGPEDDLNEQRGEGSDEFKGIVAPRRGTVTKEEAYETLQRQVETMQNLDTEQVRTVETTDHAKKQLTEAMQILNRLEQEQRVAERLAKQVESQERDLKVEAQCKTHLATLDVLKGLLGITSIGAPTPTCLRSVYKVQDSRARSFCSEVAVLIHFTHQAGRIKGYELQSAAGQVLTDRLAPPQSPTRAHLDRAVAANDASLLIQEILVCIESARSNKQIA